VKICGLTNPADAWCAVESGADALGFNLYPGSKRCISLERCAGWMEEFAGRVRRVAVVVNLPIEEAIRLAAHPALDAVQLHGDEDEAYCARFAKEGRPFIKALRLGSEEEVQRAGGFSTEEVLLDSAVAGAFGGTGHGVNLPLAARVRELFPSLRVFLAGGLNPGNVGRAVREVAPYAVDVASGVESEPGRKDPALMRAFVLGARGVVGQP